MPQNKLILVIDKSATNIMVLSNILETNGFETITAHYGAMGIMQAQFHKPELIFLNINLPTMDGYKVCKCLKAEEETQNIPVIFISTFEELQAKVKAVAAGGDAYLTQPVLIEELLACVKTHLMLQHLRQLNQKTSQLLRTAAQDLKHPLSEILETVKAFEELAKTDKVLEYANWIKTTVEQMHQIINNVLNAIEFEKQK